jgi:hypothetical protein
MELERDIRGHITYGKSKVSFFFHFLQVVSFTSYAHALACIQASR